MSETESSEMTETCPVQKSDAEWKKQLSPDTYRVLRQGDTERPFSSPLNKIYEEGVYVCAGCQTPLYESKYKFDSGTGWPSFDRPIESGVAYDTDTKIGYERIEVHCSNCCGHLGHVFDDGPPETTGKRHCINGVAMEFIPAKS